MSEASFGLGKSGKPRFPQEDPPSKEPMRPSRDATYHMPGHTSNPKKSRRDHSVGKPFEEDFDWDLSDIDDSPVARGRGGVQKIAPQASKAPPKYTPGVSDPNSPVRPGRRRFQRPVGGRRLGEETPFGGPERRANPMGTTRPGGAPERRRARRDTTQFQLRPDTPLQRPVMGFQSAETEPGESSWDVYVDGAGVYKVPASDEKTALDRAEQWLNSGGDPDHSGRKFPRTAFQAVRSESSGVAGSLGGQAHTGREKLEAVIYKIVKEIVRKKPGGGGYMLYAPNKGKKKNPKPVGEFPTRLAAKKAELARFPPKDAEQLKRARARLDKLAKDPKKRIEKEKEELKSKTPKKSGRAAGARKKAAESMMRGLVNTINERLFREDELVGSPWDERLSSLQPDAVTADKRFAALCKAIEKGSRAALDDAHRGLGKFLRGVGKVIPGDYATDPERNKMFVPVSLQIDDDEVGPIHLYVDGGHVRIEISPEAREMISGMDPDIAREVRGGLMSFQEDYLPRIETARKAWEARDKYLEKLQAKLDGTLGGMSPIEIHLAKEILSKGDE